MNATNLVGLLERTKATCEAINHGLWTGRFTSPAVRAVAERHLDRFQGKAERIIRVLRWRYGMDV